MLVRLEATETSETQISMIPERVRIAPSPTGMVHIGTVRTALYDYFMAKQSGGAFVLRVEDTDQARSVEGGIENIVTTLHRLGIDPDEGFIYRDGNITEVGDKGPYLQSERLQLYRDTVDQLIQQGDAYYSFLTPEELQEIRAARQKHKTSPRLDREKYMVSPEEAKANIEAGMPYVVRMKIPEGKSEFVDVIRGKVVFDHEEVDDQVILKSDGFPTYHLAVVVDDHLMGITTVLRGEEWISSTPKQLILYKMLGWEAPKFAHVPLLLNPNKSKLSKRQGDVSAASYLDKGYLKEALVNFLATLGYNPTGDREIYTLQELIDLFDISKVKKSGAVVNFEKLDWMNRQYMAALPTEELLERLDDFLDIEPPLEIARIVDVEKARATTLVELAELVKVYVTPIDYETPILVWKKSSAKDALDMLRRVRIVIADHLDDWSEVAYIEDKVKAWIADQELGVGNVLWPLRVSLSGKERSASPFEYLYVLGQQEALKRVDAAIDRLVG